MIGKTILREFVGANSFAAAAGTNLAAPIFRVLGVLFILAHLQQTRTQHGQRSRFVLQLRTFVSALDNQPTRLVMNLHRRIRCVDALAPWSTSAADGDF